MSSMPLVLTRRMVLVGSGAALSGACASAERGSGRSSTSDPTASADVLRVRALAAETDLLARYDAALALPNVVADSALKAKLTAIRAEHASHASAITGDDKVDPTPVDSLNMSPSPSPGDTKTMIVGLVKAEQDAASARTADILAADGGTAMLLASIAAAESGHAALLLGGAA